LIKEIYSELFRPVQMLINDDEIIRDSFKLSFSASIAASALADKLLGSFISQGAAGSFCGSDNAKERLSKILSEYSFENEESTLSAIECILEHLRADFRNAKRTLMVIDSQLRKGMVRGDLYFYLWSLEYLTPTYLLRLDGKELSQLSPGERGALLLVFYLLVDKDTRPIIIDQPEENLDNETVFGLLVPIVKRAKQRRQVIVVTHNPNIAVCCDAEQIIIASMDKTNNNMICYEAGSIESFETNRRAIRVLEGSRPAFDKRDDKYFA
jgi:wobble nucleotide-excising tRNase